MSDFLSRHALESVYAHAAECYPLEACGFVRAAGAVVRARNAQDELHAQDPVRHDRTADAGFTFAAEDALALSRSFRTGDPAVVIYHSHPDVGAYFSERDRQAALFEGRPVYDVRHLVVDVAANGVRGAKAFEFQDGHFVCVWSETLDPPGAQKRPAREEA